MYDGDFNTASQITSTHVNGTSQIIYTFSLTNNSLSAGTYTCAAEIHLQGVNRTASADTYVLKATNLCGITKTISGTF